MMNEETTLSVAPSDQANPELAAVLQKRANEVASEEVVTKKAKDFNAFKSLIANRKPIKQAKLTIGTDTYELDYRLTTTNYFKLLTYFNKASGTDVEATEAAELLPKLIADILLDEQDKAVGLEFANQFVAGSPDLALAFVNELITNLTELDLGKKD